VYVVAVAALTGTHTLTLVWGVTFLLLSAALVAACYWCSLRARLRRGLEIAGLTALGVCINAWILMPLFAYHTRLVENEPDPIGGLAYTDPERLFSLFRDSGDPYSIVRADIEAQLPVLALLWTLVCGAVYWRFLSPAARRLALGFLGLGGALLLLVLAPSLIEDLPRALRFIQFPYRVLTYVDLCVVALVTLALAAMQRDRLASRLPVAALAAIAALNLGLSIDQIFKVRSWLPNLDAALASSVQPPPSWYASLQFADGSAPVVKPTLDGSIRFPVEEGREDSYQASYPPGPAGSVRTNIATGTYFVDVTGARPIGRTPTGEMVVQLERSAGPRKVTVRAEAGAAIAVGKWLTALSLVASLMLLSVGIVRRKSR
jgi:hypothetical protein